MDVKIGSVVAQATKTGKNSKRKMLGNKSFHFEMDGDVFDIRSVLLSVSGLTGGRSFTLNF